MCSNTDVHYCGFVYTKDASTDEDECSKTFIDPISLEMMHDPVFTTDGQSYDRASIVGWFDSQEQQGITRFTAPLTGTVSAWFPMCMA